MLKWLLIIGVFFLCMSLFYYQKKERQRKQTQLSHRYQRAIRYNREPNKQTKEWRN